MRVYLHLYSELYYHWETDLFISNSLIYSVSLLISSRPNLGKTNKPKLFRMV